MYRYLTILEGTDPDSAGPIFHTEDAGFIRLVLRLASRQLRRAADARRTAASASSTGRSRHLDLLDAAPPDSGYKGHGAL